MKVLLTSFIAAVTMLAACGDRIPSSPVASDSVGQTGEKEQKKSQSVSLNTPPRSGAASPPVVTSATEKPLPEQKQPSSKQSDMTKVQTPSKDPSAEGNSEKQCVQFGNVFSLGERFKLDCNYCSCIFDTKENRATVFCHTMLCRDGHPGIITRL